MVENIIKNCYVDINECLVDNGGCEFLCINLKGIGGLPDISRSGSGDSSLVYPDSANSISNLGYQCECDTGYQLAPNHHDCIGMCTAIAEQYI